MNETCLVPVVGRKVETSLEILESFAEARLRNLQLQLGVAGGTGFMRDVILITRELADLREKVKVLEPYVQHKEDCPFIEDMTNGDTVLAKGNPQCTCGLAEVRVCRPASCASVLHRTD